MGSGASAGTGSGGTFPGAGGSAGTGGGYPVAVCGNAWTEWPESCDDGNVDDGDGCDAACQTEAGYNCDYWGGGCRLVVCGDGMQDGYSNGDGTWVYEGCDDGNPDAGDGCSDECQLEPGFTCSEGPGVPCREVVCGDGFQDGYYLPSPDGSGGTGGTGMGTGGFAAGAGGQGGFVTYFYEQCDDGNPSSGDGCSDDCTVEPGYICDLPNTSCRIPVCGDGRQDFIATGGTGGSGTGGSGFAGSGPGGTWEGCDDGNTSDDDGCNGTCQVEEGWLCERPAEPCRQPRCGDGFIDFVASGGAGGTAGTGSAGGGFGGELGGGYEECDDGNEADDDGCSGSCTREEGWACQYPGEPCYLAVCGDGTWDWPVEQCDDGNDVSGDGCTDCEYDFSGAGGSAGAGGMGFAGGGGSGG